MFAHLFQPSRMLLMMVFAASVMAPDSLIAQESAAEEPIVAVTLAPTTSSLLFAPSGPAAREFLASAPDAWARSKSPEAVLPGVDERIGPDLALMAVGGAGLVAGLVLGGDGGLVIATGGAVVGLIGLYRYFR